MYPLFESISVLDGEIQNAEFHINRFEQSYRKFFWENPKYDLLDAIEIPEAYQKGQVKLRVSYGKEHKEFSLHNYKKREINSLKLVHNDEIEYDLKFQDRSGLDALFELKNDCDDVLIVKDGCITDASYANIVFFDGDTWFTPTSPLLKGTMRAKLLNERLIFERIIKEFELPQFVGFQLINSMLGFNNQQKLSIENIKR